MELILKGIRAKIQPLLGKGVIDILIFGDVLLVAKAYCSLILFLTPFRSTIKTN